MKCNKVIFGCFRIKKYFALKDVLEPIIIVIDDNIQYEKNPIYNV